MIKALNYFSRDVCATLSEAHSFAFAEASRLLNEAVRYLYERAQYTQVESLFKRALKICEQKLGLEHPDTAAILNDLTMLYHDQGKYEQAETLYQRALAIWEQQLGSEHPDTAQSLHNLAGLYRAQGQYEQAEPLYQRVLAIREQRLGPEHPRTIETRRGYVHLLRVCGRSDEAAALEAVPTQPGQPTNSHDDMNIPCKRCSEACRHLQSFTLHIRKSLCPSPGSVSISIVSDAAIRSRAKFLTRPRATTPRPALSPVVAPSLQRIAHADEIVARPLSLHIMYAPVHIPPVDTPAQATSPVASSPSAPGGQHTTVHTCVPPRPGPDSEQWLVPHSHERYS